MHPMQLGPVLGRVGFDLLAVPFWTVPNIDGVDELLGLRGWDLQLCFRSCERLLRRMRGRQVLRCGGERVRFLSERHVSNGNGIVELLELRRWQVQCRHKPIDGVHRCLCGGPLLGFGRDVVPFVCDGQVLNRLGVCVYLVWRGEVSNRRRFLELRRL